MTKDLEKIRHELFVNTSFTDEQLFNDRIEFFKKEFHLSDAKINKLIEKNFLFLRNDPNTVLIKKAALMAHFGYTNEEISHMFPKCSVMFNHDPQMFIDNEAAYMKEFNLTKSEVKKIFYAYPNIMELDESLQDKIKFFVEDLKIEKSKLTPMIKKQPTAFGYGVKTMKEKAKAYFEEFGYSYLHLGKMLMKNAGLFGYDPDTIKSKKQVFIKDLGYTESEVTRMFFDAPVLMGLEKPEIIRKFKLANELGLDRDYILKRPTILMAPAGSLKVRYMILYIATRKKDFLQTNWWLTSHQVTWARLNGLFAANKTISASALLSSRSTFKRVTGLISNDLVAKYPFDLQTMHAINAEYARLAEQDGGLDLFVSDEELLSIGKKKK